MMESMNEKRQKEGNELIWRGNILLLELEQDRTLQGGVYREYPRTAAGMSKWFTINSPIPGGPSFQSFVPGGNIGNFNDRWKWVSEALVPEWRALYEADQEKVKKQMMIYLTFGGRP